MPSSTVLTSDIDPSPESATPQQDLTDRQDDDPENAQPAEPTELSAELTEEAPEESLAHILAEPLVETAKHSRSDSNGRLRSSPKKTEPTLFHDFLLGRPSAARKEAERKRRESVEALKAEIRYEMKQSQVRKLQQPNGVKARVKAWQKANADAITHGTPEDAASEPTDVAFDEEEFVSVTEEDRIRIKMRQKKRSTKSSSKTPNNKSEVSLVDSDAKSRVPRKRIVSDDHWVKPKARKVSVRKVSPRPRKSTTPTRIPSGFAFRAVPNPSAASKVKAWAEKVDVKAPPRSMVSSVRSGRLAPHDDEDDDEDDSSDVDDAASRGTARRSVKTAEFIDEEDPKLEDEKKEDDRSGNTDDDNVRENESDAKGNEDGNQRGGTRLASISEHPPKDLWLEENDLRPPKPIDDNAIRIKPLSPVTSEVSTQRAPGSPLPRPKSRTMSAPSSSSEILENLIKAVEEATELSRLTEDPDSYIEAPVKRRRSKSQPPAKRESTVRTRTRSINLESALSDNVTIYSANHPPSLMNKSVADIPGEIPFGHSAFSELDLPMREPSRTKSRAKQRPRKADRNTSLRGMPSVLKKVVEEGKKILQDINEPPRNTTPNNPPSIEKWLSTTVDPFEIDSGVSRPVDDDLTELEPIETPKSRKPRRKTSQETKSSAVPTSYISSGLKTASSDNLTVTESATSTPKASKSTPKSSPKNHDTPQRVRKSSSSSGLKRSRATRNSTSSRSSGKKPLLGVLKEAFQGESSGHLPIKDYSSHEERKYESDADMDSKYMQSNSEFSSWVTESRSSDTASSASTARDTSRLAPPRLRPPTNGVYELSTILSAGSSGGKESELAGSDDSDSTLTRSTSRTKRTGSTKSSKSLSRRLSRRQRKSHNQSPGLKRRLTKHSDLVSVLSTPDDSSVPQRIRSNRSRPSIRRARGPSADVTNEDLLKEFIDDESLYRRELKTLVDGVIPVLLTHVVGSVTATELFGPTSARERVDSMSKAVVNMGICLDKLKHAHRKASSATDLRKLANWAHGVVPIYNNYLTAWRSGFEDLVVNLAPRAEAQEDEDSLLNLLPRNEVGDLINADGERVAVAYLLKRPLIRIKQMSKLIKCIDGIYRTDDTKDLLKDFDALQEKSRRRHREEVARLVDEEAVATDKTRARDLRTLGAAKVFNIDASRQVNAKDIFSLDLVHSNGQRLECQVELVHRDKQDDRKDEGDLLIREVGDGNRTYLLFPPISMSLVSARAGDGEFELVVMVRGNHKKRQWYELLKLYADEAEQILDWLQILPPSPVPAKQSEPSILEEEEMDDGTETNPFQDPDMPIGAQSVMPERARQSSLGPSQSLEDLVASLEGPSESPPPPLPTYSDIEREDRAKEQEQEWEPGDDAPKKSRSSKEELRPDPVDQERRVSASTNNSNTTSASTNSPGPYKGADGAPPPPIHRTLSSSPQQQQKSKSQSLKPPVDLHLLAGGVKRRTSSPLKHEYLPSDISSASVSEVSLSENSEVSEGEEEEEDEETETETETGTETETEEEQDEEKAEDEATDLESSEDELESVDDIPRTDLGYSIRDDNTVLRRSIVPSECSLTPSNSASQAGLHGPKAPPVDRSRYLAKISRWADRGAWKDISSEQCSIIVSDGLIEAYALRMIDDELTIESRPLLAMDLTPLVLIRQSTSVDLEIRSSLQSHCKMASRHSGGNFRFRCLNSADCYNLYMIVHHARLHNQKFIQLENESRFQSFGERRAPERDEENSSRKRGWFGRKNSYRSSVRAPAQSFDGESSTPSSASATSFLRRLTLVGNFSFNLAKSSVNKHSHPSSGRHSLYTANSGSSSGSGSSPRSPSVSVENSGRAPVTVGTENIPIRLHLLVSATKWEDHGNCSLQIRRPPPGWHQALRADHGLEKRITVTTKPKKKSEKSIILLDAVLGSGCFSPMGTRGIVCGIWEELKDEKGVVGKASASGPTGGNIKKWCFQFATVGEANWVLRLVHQEVVTV